MVKGNIVKGEKGQALPLALAALALGVLLIPVFMQSVSSHSIASRVYTTSIRQRYACDAGVEEAIWRLEQGQTSVPQFTLNDNTIDVAVQDLGGGNYDITSVATGSDGSSITVESTVQVTSGGGQSVFDYAAISINGNIRLDNDASIYSSPANDGDVYATGGNVDLNNTSSIDGDATATGTIDVASGASIGGTQTAGADPFPNLSSQTASINSKVQAWKTSAQNHDVECGDISCGSYTWNSNSTWEPPSGTYGRVYTKRHMSISGSGTWTFTDTVCTGRTLYIQGSANVVFQGQVKTGYHLEISTSGTVIFQDKVCVGSSSTRDLKISGSGETTFSSPVYVQDILQITQSADTTFAGTVKVDDDVNISGTGTITFESPIVVADNIQITGNGGTVNFEGSVFADDLTIEDSKVVNLVGPSSYDIDTIGVYVTNQVTLRNTAQLKGGQNIVAEYRIRLYNSSQINPDISDAADIPFLVATGNRILLDNSADATALAYAPNERVYLTGSSNTLYGCAIGANIRLEGSNGEIENPTALRDRTDLQSLVGAGGTGSVDIVTWK
jgi:cytoskeletal protein CcmA (bactofilin family)